MKARTKAEVLGFRRESRLGRCVSVNFYYHGISERHLWTGDAKESRARPTERPLPGVF